MKKTVVRQDPRWPRAHEGLRREYDKRVPKDMSQSEFGAIYEIGSQGIVWQYLAGWTPLNYDAAAKFARGLGCHIRDFSPEMADWLEREIIPVIGVHRGGRLRRATASIVAATALGAAGLPAPAEASIYHNYFSVTVLQVLDLNTHCMRIRRWFYRVLLSIACKPLVIEAPANVRFAIAS